MDDDESNNFRIKPLDEKTRKTDLLKQELDVNLQEQVLVNKRIELIKDSFKTIMSTEPEYAIFLTQLEMDQIQLDELKAREFELKSNIQKFI